MSQGKRPGGLTALAVINFVFSGFAMLGILGLLVLIALWGQLETMEGQEGEDARQAIDQVGGLTWIWVSGIMNVVNAVLLLVSGIGYLKMKRVMGRMVGSAYALLSLAFSLLFAVMVHFDFSILIGIVYPVLTLILLNTTFKDDLVN